MRINRAVRLTLQPPYPICQTPGKSQQQAKTNCKHDKRGGKQRLECGRSKRLVTARHLLNNNCADDIITLPNWLSDRQDNGGATRRRAPTRGGFADQGAVNLQHHGHTRSLRIFMMTCGRTR